MEVIRYRYEGFFYHLIVMIEHLKRLLKTTGNSDSKIPSYQCYLCSRDKDKKWPSNKPTNKVL